MKNRTKSQEFLQAIAERQNVINIWSGPGEGKTLALIVTALAHQDGTIGVRTRGTADGVKVHAHSYDVDIKDLARMVVRAAGVSPDLEQDAMLEAFKRAGIASFSFSAGPLFSTHPDLNEFDVIAIDNPDLNIDDAMMIMKSTSAKLIFAMPTPRFPRET